MEKINNPPWFLFLLLYCLPGTDASAQVQKQDWIGTYSMNHDGWPGTLVIQPTKSDCNTSPWCDLNISYLDTQGKRLRAGITRISPDWQTIDFRIGFPQHVQTFRGFLFSRDKNRMAGTTVWNNRTFGFIAQKEAAIPVRDPDPTAGKAPLEPQEKKETTANPNEVIKRTVLADGRVELTYQDGRKEIHSDGKIETIFPDGRKQTAVMMQVMALVPPLPNDTNVNKWLDALNSNMDDIVAHLLEGDASSVNNYKKNLQPFTGAERINKSMKTISFLVD